MDSLVKYYTLTEVQVLLTGCFLFLFYNKTSTPDGNLAIVVLVSLLLTAAAGLPFLKTNLLRIVGRNDKMAAHGVAICLAFILFGMSGYWPILLIAPTLLLLSLFVAHPQGDIRTWAFVAIETAFLIACAVCMTHHVIQLQEPIAVILFNNRVS